MSSLIANFSGRKAKGKMYYRYRMPDGGYAALGKDRVAAEIAARVLNQKRNQEVKSNNLPVGASGRTMRQLIDLYEPVKLRSSKSRASQEAWQWKFNSYRKWMGDWKVAKVTVLHLDELLEKKALSYDPYRLHRLLIAELFTYALGKGWRRQIDGNPGKALLPPKLARIKTPKLRKRMTLDIFYAIRLEAPLWLQLGMDLALHIGIRRGDLCTLTLDAFKDGYLYLIPSKTADLLSPMAIKIALTGDLTKILHAARNLSPLSPYFLHRSYASRSTYTAGERKHRTQVLPEQVTRHFKRAQTKAVEKYPKLFKDYNRRELPTFHEIRSLCARLYQEQGRSRQDIQVMLGHADESMTEMYQSGYGVQWQEVTAELKLAR